MHLMYLRKNVQWTGEMCTSLRRAAMLGHCVGTRGGGAAVGSRGHGQAYPGLAWRGARRHCGSSPSTAAHKLNLLCTWWKLFPHFCRMRKLLLLIIFPLNAVGSTFSQALLLFSYLDPIPKGFHILHYGENLIFVCLVVHLFISLNKCLIYAERENFYSSSSSL